MMIAACRADEPQHLGCAAPSGLWVRNIGTRPGDHGGYGKPLISAKSFIEAPPSILQAER